MSCFLRRVGTSGVVPCEYINQRGNLRPTASQKLKFSHAPWGAANGLPMGLIGIAVPPIDSSGRARNSEPFSRYREKCSLDLALCTWPQDAGLLDSPTPAWKASLLRSRKCRFRLNGCDFRSSDVTIVFLDLDLVGIDVQTLKIAL